ncbi:hypothetical protein B0H21DRAFT_13540 [Amylocystis lapponica]|nr:hypothetical protein B0H21DRAFT_13540 [Amylocystis lapponica]
MSPPLSSLPTEIWLQIFRLATISPLTARLRATTYSPFETANVGITYDEATKVKFVLVLVCKQWRRLVTEFLYEDVCLRHPEAFQAALERGAGDDPEGYGRWVRRVYLPYSSSATATSHPLAALRILEQCPQLEILVRIGLPRVEEPLLRFEFPATCPSLASLRRLDWWHHNEASGTGGINSLFDVLNAAPNIQYLTLGGDVWLGFLQTSPVSLPSLTTLRLLRMSVLFVREISRWSLPQLTHVIIDTVTTFDMLHMFWHTFGARIQTLELGISLRYYISDALSFVLAGCPNLKELNYHVHLTKACRLPDGHPILATIGLHSHSNAFSPVGGTSYWEHLEAHLALFSEPVFPALKRVVLYGDWSAALEDSRYPFLIQPLRDRGCMVEVSKN